MTRLWLILLSSAMLLPARVASAIATNAANSAEAWLTRTWQTDEGLPDNNITGLAQTKDGFLWVATLGGLMRFDGASFEEFSTVHLPNVPNRNVRKMYLDGHGSLWLVMDRGAVIRVEESAARVFGDADGFTDSRVAAVAEDSAEGIWFVGANGISRVEGDHVQRFDPQEVASGGNPWLVTDKQGQLWFARGSQVGIVRRAGRWETLLTVDSNPVRLLAANSGGVWIFTATQILKFSEGGQAEEIARLPDRVAVKVMLEDHSGTLWLGTATDGLLRFQEHAFEHVPVSHPEISALMEDREGNLWVGTGGGGLNLLRPRAMDLITTKTGLPFESVRSVCQDADGWIWTALQDGSLARRRGSQWETVTSAEGWPGGNATCVAAARDGGIWIGTHWRGLQRWRAGKIEEWGKQEGLGSQAVRSLLAAANGDVWVATDAPSRVRLFRDGKFYPLKMPAGVRSIRAMAEGVDGTIWVGTSDGQILRVQDRTLVNEASAEDRPPYSVRCLHTTPDGSLWIGYAGWGVGRWRNGQYARISSTDGLYDDYVSQILSDQEGGVWLTGNHGLFQVRFEDLVRVAEGRSAHLRSIAYGRSEGLPSLQPYCENSPAACRGADGQLWFATRNGLLTVQPGKIRDNPFSPPVLLNQVKVDDRVVGLYGSRFPLRAPERSNAVDLRAPGVRLQLPPGHGKIEFVFTALSFNSPENVHFRHRLKGFDTEWVEAGTQRTAKYPGLPAGRYEFEVTACNEAGVWSKAGFHLPFVVQPYLWQRWWFQLGFVAAFTAGVVGLVRYFSFRRLHRKVERLEQQAALQKERTRIARDMHDEVGSKLSRLSLLSEMASQQPDLPAVARVDVAEISETARDTIRSFEEIVWAVNPKNDSLANLIHYLCRFAEDFFEGSSTQCVFDVPDAIPPIELPTEVRHHVFLAAKEALNNVLKHARAKQVRVRACLTENGFEMVIEDDGCGFTDGAVPSRVGSGNGLENMRARMKSAGGEFQLQSRAGVGTCVVFRIGGVRMPVG